jgi:translation initiation factor 2 alpha subunit (eIF-2alpha)
MSINRVAEEEEQNKKEKWKKHRDVSTGVHIALKHFKSRFSNMYRLQNMHGNENCKLTVPFIYP